MLSPARNNRNVGRLTLSLLFLLAALALPPGPTFAREGTLVLDELIAEGLRNSPEIQAARLRADAAGYRIPQAKSLPDPMATLGYQNDGFNRFTLGDSIMTMGIAGVSQQFPFWGSGHLRARWRHETQRARWPCRPLRGTGWWRR